MNISANIVCTMSLTAHLKKRAWEDLCRYISFLAQTAPPICIGICPSQSDYCDQQTQDSTVVCSLRSNTQQKKRRQCAYPASNGSIHVNPARKLHLSDKNCPLQPGSLKTRFYDINMSLVCIFSVVLAHVTTCDTHVVTCSLQ